MKALSLGIGLLMLLSVGCAGGSHGSARGGYHTESSQAVNSKEVVKYKQALIRCHKTGGTRIVKINGNLRCF